ncbi:MAG TPA: aminotransferase class IV [Puia sp.]
MASSNSLNPGHSPSGHVNYNGRLFPSDAPLLSANNRGFRYGDGLFETMLVKKDGIRLAVYHFDRLLAGMRFLLFDIPPTFTERLTREIFQLCEANDHFATGAARVRLVVFRGDGSPAGPLDTSPHYLIQSWSLPPDPGFNEQGLKLGLFPDARKASGDPLSNIKSNNYLLYSLASAYAGRQGWDDCLVLNTLDRVADSSIANLFYARDGVLYTPPLSEGGVAGVMRRHLLDLLPQAGYPVHERAATVEHLLEADEIFLTNALKPLRWVRSLQGRLYESRLSALVYEQLVKSL